MVPCLACLTINVQAASTIALHPGLSLLNHKMRRYVVTAHIASERTLAKNVRMLPATALTMKKILVKNMNTP
jgi:hypothetical protein